MSYRFENDVVTKKMLMVSICRFSKGHKLFDFLISSMYPKYLCNFASHLPFFLNSRFDSLV